MSRNTQELSKNIWQYKVLEYLSYLTVLIVPLYAGMGHFFAFGTSKIIIMIGLSIFMMVFFLWGKWNENYLKIRFSFISLAVFLFILILTISSIFGIDPINSFFGWRNVMPLIAMYSLAIFALIIGFLVNKNRRVAINILSISLISSVIIIILFYTGLPNSNYNGDGSTLGNSSYLGTYILFNFFFGLGLFLYFKKLWKKIVIALGTLFIVINPLFISKDFLLGNIGVGEILSNPASLLGIANGATMGIGISIIFILFLFMFFSKKKNIKITGLIMVVVLLFSIFFVGRELVTPNTKIRNTFIEIKTGNRFIAWDIAKQGFNDHPILGNGYNNYIYNFGKYYNTDLYKSEYVLEKFIQPHNVIWEFASNTGILGLVGYLSLLLVLFFTLLNKNKNVEGEDDKAFMNVRIVLAGLLLGYFIQNLFVFDTISTYLMLFTIVAIGLGVSRKYEFILNKRLLILKKIYIILGIIISVSLIYPLVVAPWVESKQMKRIMTTEKNLVDFHKIRDGLQDKSIFGGIMDDTLLSGRLFKVYQSNLYKVDDKNKIFFIRELDSVILQLENDIIKQPFHGDSYLLISRMLNLRLLTEMKNNDKIRFDGKNYNKEVWNKSYNFLMKAESLNPNDPQIYLVLSQLYMISGDFKNAYFYNKTAIDMVPEYKDGYEFARSLLKINPNKDFENYLNSMEKGI